MNQWTPEAKNEPEQAQANFNGYYDALWDGWNALQRAEEARARAPFIAMMRKPEGHVLYHALQHIKREHEPLNWKDVYQGIATGATVMSAPFDTAFQLQTKDYLVYCQWPQNPRLNYEDFSLYYLHQSDNSDCPCEICKATRAGQGLKRLDTPRRCEIGIFVFDEIEDPGEQCENTAHWQYNGVALCKDCMKAMSRMNSDNEEAFASALTEV